MFKHDRTIKYNKRDHVWRKNADRSRKRVKYKRSFVLDGTDSVKETLRENWQKIIDKRRELEVYANQRGVDAENWQSIEYVNGESGQSGPQ